jgi:MFS transporter, DHA2 family, multidrug resistance protein
MSIMFLPAKIRRRKDQKADKVMTMADWFAVWGASLGAFMAVLDIQITNASLREIQGSLGLDLAESGWISTAYLIAETLMIPLTGYLSEVFGIRRFIMVNCFLFIIASVLCGLAWNVDSIIAFRIFQGLVGGALVPLAFQILLIFIPSEKRHLSMVIFGLTATLAPTIGPSLGGWLTEHFGWRYVFFINIFPGALMLYLIFRGIRSGPILWQKLKQIDLPGILFLSAGLGTLTYVLEEGARQDWFDSRTIQICTLTALISLTIFIVSQLFRKNPLLNLFVLGDRNFLFTSLITMISGAALYGGIFSLSIYLGQIQNYRAADIGSVIMWLGVPQLMIMPLLPLLMKHVNLKALAVIGLLIFAYSNYLNAFMDSNYSGDQVRLSLLIRAIGQPLFMIPISTIGMALVSHQTAGNASSIFNMMRNLGGSIGVAMASTFMLSRQQLHFQQIVASLNSGNNLLGEYLYKLEAAFRIAGHDIVAAKQLAIKLISSIALRDSFIQAFNDIFIILAMGLALAAMFVLMLKPVDSSNVFLE